MEQGTENRTEGKPEGRDYTRKGYQNLMAVVELLDEKSPLPVTQRQIQEATGLSKSMVFDICWNLAARRWAEVGDDGAARITRGGSDRDAYMGRMMKKLVMDNYRLKEPEEA